VGLMSTSALALVGALALAAEAAPPNPSIPFESYRLANGLTVILSQDHTAPIVGVDVLYNVGSKDEKPGRTGFAHLFEHLMFQGSKHLPKGEADRLVEAAGGANNGATRPDTTEYWQQAPSNALEQLLYVESDRMGFLLETIDQAKLDNQREVVRNERRQNYEMRPYGLAFKVLLENVWDPKFPYHWLPIGSHEDLQAATLEDVKEFFRRYYGPENAFLAIAGDFDKAEAKRMVEKWFGTLPGRGQPPERAFPQPEPLREERRATMEDDVQLPRVHLAWQTPKLFAPGDAALDLAGMILSDGKSARLVKRLVMDERIVQNVSAGQSSQMLAGMFVVVATPKPGIAVERVEREIDEEIARLAKEGPTQEELDRAKNKIEAQMIFALEPVGGFGGRAAVLNTYAVHTGDPGFLAKDLERYRAVTREDVKRSVAEHLGPKARAVVTVFPRKGGPSASAAPPARRSITQGE
jgi:zinc protease